jgi:hypothetical protein
MVNIRERLVAKKHSGRAAPRQEVDWVASQLEGGGVGVVGGGGRRWRGAGPPPQGQQQQQGSRLTPRDRRQERRWRRQDGGAAGRGHSRAVESASEIVAVQSLPRNPGPGGGGPYR